MSFISKLEDNQLLDCFTFICHQHIIKNSKVFLNPFDKHVVLFYHFQAINNGFMNNCLDDCLRSFVERFRQHTFHSFVSLQRKQFVLFIYLHPVLYCGMLCLHPFGIILDPNELQLLVLGKWKRAYKSWRETILII